MRRVTVNFVALIFGFLVGAFFSYAHAGIVFANSDGIITRSADGRISTLNFPSDPLSRGERSLLESMSRDSLTLKDSGNWDVQDKNGNKVSIPGKQTVKLPGSALSKAAGTVAFLAKGTVATAVAGYLIQEGIHLASDMWIKQHEANIPPGLVYEYIPPAQTRSVYTSDANTAAVGSCGYVAHNSEMTFIEVQNMSYSDGRLKFDCVLSRYTFRDMIVIAKVACSDGSAPVQGSCGTGGSEQPATEQDLQNALDNRRQMIDDALADYYDSLPKEKRNELAKTDGEFSASGSPTSGPVKTSQTTKPDGTTQTTSTTTVNNITHQGNTYNTSVVSVVSNTTTSITENGQTTTTTENEDVGIKEPDKTDCEKNPNSIGCSEFGSVSDSELERKELEGTVSPVDMGGGGQCPAPVGVTVRGSRIELSFEPACDYARAIRPIILALAWLTAGFILIGAVRES